MSRSLLVTGSSGLIGSEVARYFSHRGWRVHGIDNNQRAVFFGPQGDTRWNQARLESELSGFTHHELDVRNRSGILSLIDEVRPAAIVHAAAQPSHDKAAEIPFDDFDTNAVGTMNILEGARRFAPDSPFIHMSTNKVYGDKPNEIALREDTTRWEYADPRFANGISESLSIDQSKHSIFGASKVASDIMVQEYGRYFGIPTACLRGGCLTGPSHSGVELHGFLSYLIKCNLEERPYRIYGYKGKQVRDNIHSEDVARLMEMFIESPRVAEVYNVGGGRENSCSILEAFDKVEAVTGHKQVYSYEAQHRAGDHICYYSDLSKIFSHYPNWSVSISLQAMIIEIAASWRQRVCTSTVRVAT